MSTGGMMTPNQRAGAPQLTIEEMTAACEEAHKAGFPVGAHAESDEGVRNAVLAGVDSVEHGHGATVETLAADARARHGADPDDPVRPARSSRRRRRPGIPAVRRRQVRPAGRRADRDAAPRVPDGRDDHGRQRRRRAAGRGRRRWPRRSRSYVQHGLSPQKALESATINTARLFRLAEVGYLEPGWHADLLVLDGDPLDDVARLPPPGDGDQGGRTRS